MPNGSDKASSQKGKGVWFSILRELKPHKFGLTIALVLGDCSIRVVITATASNWLYR